MAYNRQHRKYHAGGDHQFANGDAVVGGTIDFSGDEQDDTLSASGGGEIPNDDMSADDQLHHIQQQQKFINEDLRDKPIYLLEHLATFTVNKESGIIYPADGMRRLLQLEKTTGIWSQKMQLCLNYQWILIMDFETGNIIERFPATLIQEPTAFTSTDAMELYNNILVFIVSGNGSDAPSEMHIFQSQSVSAVLLVEDLRNLRNGKLVTQQRDTQLLHKHYQQQKLKGGTRTDRIMTAAPELYHQAELHHHSTHQHGGDSGDAIEHQHAGSGQHHNVNVGGMNDETSSTSSDKYERDVTVLNHCFDDIEKFIARLQHAAAATRELERRRRNRKTKKKDPGEGLLTLRTRPPHEKEFIDIFAKFKLSFNLLAKLKAHIHDPNAPELVHFLFTPLALIVEAAGDTYYDAQLPARVIAPLLTREAINLLVNCVTSKETELWRSLGDAWTTPRDQWKDDVGSYHPVFLDGWSPDYLVIGELEASNSGMGLNTSTLTKAAVSTGNKRTQPTLSSRNLNGSGGTSSYDDYDGLLSSQQQYQQTYHSQQQQQQLDELTTTMTDREREKLAASADIDVVERTEVNSIQSMERNSGGNDTVGHPIVNMKTLTSGIQNLKTRSSDIQQYRQQFNDDDVVENWLDELHASGAKIVLVTYQRTANNDKELSVVRGEYLEILDDTRKWWKARNIRGQVAHVPHTIITSYNYGNGGSSDVTTDFQQQQVGGNYKTTTGPVGYQHQENDQTQIVGSPAQRPAIGSTDLIRNKHLGKKGEFRYF